VIFDARSTIAAESNRFLGKGVEDVSRYDMTTIVFLDIANIHSMRHSYDRLVSLCLESNLTDDSLWLSKLESTKWLWHLSNILKGAVKIAICLSRKQSALVHCSDGWDRTSQLAALAQVLIDPQFRSLEGFLDLIEKEFCSFGHRFEDRLGFTVSLPNEISAVFLQFLDCVRQIILQFPDAFQFKAHLLNVMYNNLYSGWLDTFRFNSEQEREQGRAKVKSFEIRHVIFAIRDEIENHD